MTHPKHAAAEHEIVDLIRRRWSPRSFDPARVVARADLLRLFEAARWAPSSLNAQPWRFVVADRAESPAAFGRVVAALHERNAAWAASASVLLLVGTVPTLEKWGVENRHAFYDTGQAMALLTIQATSMGLSVRQIEGFDPARARAAVGVPEDVDLVVIAAIGYAGEPERLEIEKHRVAEQAPRARAAIETFVFDGAWGAPFV